MEEGEVGAETGEWSTIPHSGTQSEQLPYIVPLSEQERAEMRKGRGPYTLLLPHFDKRQREGALKDILTIAPEYMRESLQENGGLDAIEKSRILGVHTAYVLEGKCDRFLKPLPQYSVALFHWIWQIIADIHHKRTLATSLPPSDAANHQNTRVGTGRDQSARAGDGGGQGTRVGTGGGQSTRAGGRHH